MEFTKVHFDKLQATLINDKLPSEDKERIEKAIKRYEEWYQEMQAIDGDTVEEIVEKMVKSLNEYKLYLDVDIIFDSPQDFLYRQKGQLKLDNTVIEEFLPLLVDKCISKEYSHVDFEFDSQTKTFSSVYFNSSLSKPGIGGEMSIKEKDQDFSLTRKLYIKSSYSPNFPEEHSVVRETNLGYVVAECKTNLDKTMFQEASATAHDLKVAVSGSQYFLLADWLDMTPISTSTTDIEEILLLRKARRIGSQKRKSFSNYKGRMTNREFYVNYLKNNPYREDTLLRFIEHIFSQIQGEDLIEEDILELGYF